MYLADVVVDDAKQGVKNREHTHFADTYAVSLVTLGGFPAG